MGGDSKQECLCLRIQYMSKKMGNFQSTQTLLKQSSVLQFIITREGGKEGGREEGRKGGREERRKGGREGGKEGGREEGRGPWINRCHLLLNKPSHLFKIIA